MDIVDWLNKASVGIYLATEASVADDISPKLKQAALEIQQLRKQLDEHPFSLSNREKMLQAINTEFADVRNQYPMDVFNMMLLRIARTLSPEKFP